MTVLDAKQARRFRANMKTFEHRLELAVDRAAELCGDDRKRERDRFATFCRRVGHRTPATAQTLDERQRIEAGAESPLIVELMFGLVGPKAVGFGYRSLGRYGGAVLASARPVLEGTLRFMLESGATPADAELVVSEFKLAYPRLDALKEFAEHTPLLLVGVVPRAPTARFQALFNTRLGNPEGHERALEGMLARSRAGWPGFAERLYDTVYREDVRFSGLGVDVEPGRPWRSNVYLLLDRSELPMVAEGLRRLLAAAPQPASADLALAGADALLAAFPADQMTGDLELSIALHEGGPPRARFSVMLKRHDPEVLAELLRRHGSDVAAVQPVLAALTAKVEQGEVVKAPVHAVALVPGAGGPPSRIDLTLEALL
jgi:hypothetical protein